MEANMTNARVLSGRGLVHRKLDKRQLACVAANAAEGQTRIDLSVAQLVAALNVSRPYIDLARSFSPEKRQAIIDGLDGTSFAALLKTPELQQLLLSSSIGGGCSAAIIFPLSSSDRSFCSAQRNMTCSRPVEATANFEDFEAVVIFCPMI